MYIRSLVSLVSALTIATASHANEPNPTIKLFMEDKVTMLDWGLYKVERMISDALKVNPATKGNIFLGPHARHDDESGGITISIRAIPFNDPTNPEKVGLCKSIIDTTRISAGVNEESGDIIRNLSGDVSFGGSKFSDQFAHASSKNNETAILFIDLYFAIIASVDDVVCSGKLLSSEVTFH